MGWLLVGLGCRDDVTPTTCEPPGPGVEPVQHVFDVPMQWTTGPRRGLRAARVLGDLDEDGFMDASVISWELDATWGDWDLHIVRGPLHRPLRLPRDAAVTVEGTLSVSGNAYDNGGIDVVVASPDEARLHDGAALLAGTSEGEVVPAYVSDVDGDGLLDQAAPLDDQTWGLWLGPASRWKEASPDLTVRFPCDDPRAVALAGGVTSIGDVTGDGVREAFSQGWVYEGKWTPDLHCTGLAFPLPAGTAPVDVIGGPETAHGFLETTGWAAVPDQTGDGIQDLLAGITLHQAPVVFDDGGGVRSGSELVPWAEPVEWVEPLGFDATGDGHPDFRRWPW